MFTTKQEVSLERVVEVFRYFYKHPDLTISLHHDELVQLAGKLTQVYFDNHYKDGTSK